KRQLALRVVTEAAKELFSEHAIDARRGFYLGVPHDRIIRERVLPHQEGEHIGFLAEVAVNARFEETGLPKLKPELPLWKRVGGRHDVVEAQRIEDDPGLEVDCEVAQAAQEVVIFPADQGVSVGLELIELDAAAQPDLTQLARFD